MTIKRIILVITLMTTLLLAFETQAQTSPNCISQVDLKDIASHFSQFSKYTGKEFCSDGSPDFQLLSSLMFMRSTAFDINMTKSPDDFFSGRFSQDWFGYFTGRITKIKMETSCPKGALAYVQSFMGFSDHVMHVCPIGLLPSFSTLDLSSTFMHEARHIDGFAHITCSKGPRTGIQGACDNVIADGGSYAVTVETYAQLAKYATALHPALKAYARASAAVYGQEAFETPISVQSKNELVLMTDGLQFLSLDPMTLTTQNLGNSPSAGKIVKRAAHMILIPEDKTLPGQYVFLKNQGNVSQSASDLITEYNAQSPSDKANLVDLHIGAQWTARIYKNSVRFVCDPTSSSAKDISLPAGMAAANLLYMNGYDRASFSTLLAMDNGDIYEMGCANRAGYVKVSNIKFDKKYKRIYKIDDKTFGLNFAGELFSIENGKSTLLNLPGRIIEIAPNQIYSFM